MSQFTRRQLFQAIPPFLVTPHDVSLPNLVLAVSTEPAPPALASASVRMSRATPVSPASLLTGVAQPSPTEPTLADLLRSRGYRTAFLGTWPLGGGAGQSALTRGFDEVVTAPPAPAKKPVFLFVHGPMLKLPYEKNTLTVITTPAGSPGPILAHWPGMLAARALDAPASQLDIAPTLLRVAGIPHQLAGVNLLPLWMGEVQASTRPPLFFREDWRETEAATPVTQEHVSNPDLTLQLYGPGREGIKKSHHDKPADDPYYIWSGTANGNWMVTLRHRTHVADLTGQAKIRWRSKQAGFRELRITLKLASGEWLVSSESDGPSEDWREREFILANIRWRKLDPKTIIEGAWVERPDLSRVDEIGFTDLMTGGQSIACSRLDWLEVWARSAQR